VPDALTRINAMVTGNLTFDESDILFFPYLCGYESQIQGRLSPWCAVFNDTELLNYQYSQDLAYYYGTGPGSDGAATKLFLPYMDELMTLLLEGPGQQGTGTNGTFTLPNLLMSFLNDNQLAQMTSILGIFPDEKLPIDHFPGAHLYDVSHWITMRGTVAFEVLNCSPSAPKPTTTASFSSSTTGSLIPTSTGSASDSITTSPPTSTGLANSTSVGGSSTTVVIRTVTVTDSDCDAPTSTPSSAWASHKFKRTTPTNEVYIRIILNDAVYPVLDCQSGPGNSCPLSDYAAFIHAQNEAAGDFVNYCNVTAAGHETSVPNGASFFTNLGLDYLTFVRPSGDVI